MLKKIVSTIKNIDLKILRLIYIGYIISILFFLIGTYIISLNYTYSHIIFEIGISLFKTGQAVFISFFIFGILFDSILKKN